MDSVEASWLAELCGSLPRARCAVLLRLPPGAREPRIECWPQGQPPPSALLALANAALVEGAALAEARAAGAGAALGSLCIGTPLLPGSEGRGALAVEITDAKEADTSLWLERVRAGTGWLASFERRERVHSRRAELLQLVGAALEQRTAADALVALATALATRFACERVSIGLVRRGHVRIEALSHSARFDPRSALLRDVAEAMDEACDQDASVAHPAVEGAALRIDRAHEALARAYGSAAVWTVPLVAHGERVGAITFERAGALDARTLRRAEEAAALLAPLLAAQRAAHARPLERIAARLRARLAWLARPEGRWAAAAGAVALLLLAAAPTPHRVTADARLEGRVQRAVVAGVDGYLLQVDAQPGDVVRSGQLLARLDDRDLQLERRKWSARRDQLRGEHREALAGHERTELRMLGARIEEALAQLELIDAQLARTRLVAPFDGVIVRGDLRQMLGSPVEKGQVLLEIAPLDGYRVVLEVDERDIAAVSAGQRGRLALSALPGEPLAFTVERVTPVAVAAEGRNRFRVEAHLEQPSEALRPGLEGVAKIETEPRARAWIWTHDALDWIRLTAWSWWP
jgi:RND family efflux transporter MFP subunit